MKKGKTNHQMKEFTGSRFKARKKRFDIICSQEYKQWRIFVNTILICWGKKALITKRWKKLNRKKENIACDSGFLLMFSFFLFFMQCNISSSFWSERSHVSSTALQCCEDAEIKRGLLTHWLTQSVTRSPIVLHS